MFLANYADGLTDLPLPRIIDYFQESGKVALLPVRQADLTASTS